MQIHSLPNGAVKKPSRHGSLAQHCHGNLVPLNHLSLNLKLTSNDVPSFPSLPPNVVVPP
ncbi:hypothetical protein PanWU01x14_183280 [Parasponia andersonii]|uniref:Uncharacterized protein n=1 Tax=Parasponia andersonii TaxID=3476 RepID=A0A2P5C530_PARAD|nr:hypothetical protein PanWU01x14_183280 [Parasponia andersonii]